MVQGTQPFVKKEPLIKKEMHTRSALAPGPRLGETITCRPRRREKCLPGKRFAQLLLLPPVSADPGIMYISECQLPVTTAGGGRI